jgi:uncharacterized iron-regulated membrane protein
MQTSPIANHAGHGVEDRALPWAIRISPSPAASGPENHMSIRDVLAIIDARGFDSRFIWRVRYPGRPGDVFTASFVPDRAADQHTLYVDPNSGQVVGEVGWREYSPLGKAVEWGVTVHMGREFGRANQWAGLAICGLIVSSIVSGIVMWWKRRPQGTFGAPPRLPGARIPAWLLLVILILAVVFPLVGASIVLVACVEMLRSRLAVTVSSQ